MIMQNDKVVSINNTTQIVLQGQVASESDGHRHISGTGGQLQFVRGAYASKGGKSFICFRRLTRSEGAPQLHRVYRYARQQRDDSALGRDVCDYRIRHGQFERKVCRGTG
jgi:hypothetical protein